MICYLCGNEATQGKTYTLSTEAKKMITQLGISQLGFIRKSKKEMSHEVIRNSK